MDSCQGKLNVELDQKLLRFWVKCVYTYADRSIQLICFSVELWRINATLKEEKSFEMMHHRILPLSSVLFFCNETIWR